MLSSIHAFTDRSERIEVHMLPGLQRIASEVRDDPIDEERKASNLPLHRLVASVGPERAAPEVPLDRQQDLGAVSVLADRDARPYLPADDERRPRGDRDREASLTVDESGDVRR